MHLPNMHSGAPHTAHRRFLRPSPLVIWFLLVENLFWAGCATCLLYALHRIAGGIATEARLKALKAMPEAFTEEERVVLVRKVKSHALGCL
jgi:hypothetical protein